jgi:hypothetical protein
MFIVVLCPHVKKRSNMNSRRREGQFSLLGRPGRTFLGRMQ